MAARSELDLSVVNRHRLEGQMLHDNLARVPAPLSDSQIYEEAEREHEISPILSVVWIALRFALRELKAKGDVHNCRYTLSSAKNNNL